MTIQQKIRGNSRQDPNTGCWLWAKSTFGSKRTGVGGRYGRVWWDGNIHPAHRVSFLAFRGPIPSGACVLHSCDTPLCVNPDHLFLGTQRQNIADMVAKERHRSGGKPTVFTREQILDIITSTDLVGEAARKYGVQHSAISKIRRGKTYRRFNPNHSQPGGRTS